MHDVHRMLFLGKSPKKATAKIRAELEPGFHICRSGKKKVRILHQQGRCYPSQGVDYLDYIFTSTVIPRSSGYDGVCRLCARDGVRDGGDSLATVSSSSSSEWDS